MNEGATSQTRRTATLSHDERNLRPPGTWSRQSPSRAPPPPEAPPLLAEPRYNPPRQGPPPAWPHRAPDTLAHNPRLQCGPGANGNKHNGRYPCAGGDGAAVTARW